MRRRSSVVIIENNKVVLIKRVRDGYVYYVFPGGGIEEGETPEEAAKREAFEELGVQVRIHKCLSEIEFNGIQYYFLAEIISGTFGTGQGEEYIEERDRGLYLPMWVAKYKLSSLEVFPKEVAMRCFR